MRQVPKAKIIKGYFRQISYPAPNTFVEIDYQTFSPPSADQRRAFVSNKRNSVHGVLVNGLSLACPG